MSRYGGWSELQVLPTNEQATDCRRKKLAKDKKKYTDKRAVRRAVGQTVRRAVSRTSEESGHTADVGHQSDISRTSEESGHTVDVGQIRRQTTSDKHVENRTVGLK